MSDEILKKMIAEEEPQETKALKQHIVSLRRQIKYLEGKLAEEGAGK